MGEVSPSGVAIAVAIVSLTSQVSWPSAPNPCTPAAVSEKHWCSRGCWRRRQRQAPLRCNSAMLSQQFRRQLYAHDMFSCASNKHSLERGTYPKHGPPQLPTVIG